MQGVPSDGMYMIATVQQVAHGFRMVHNWSCEVWPHRATAIKEYCAMRNTWELGEYPDEQIYRLQRVRFEGS